MLASLANPVVLDIAAEVLAGSGLSLAQAARRFPSFRQNRPVHPSCVFRWIRQGVRLPDGRRVQLEAIRLAGRLLTSEQALARFLADQQDPPSGHLLSPHTTPRRQRRAAERAQADLEKLGV